VNWPIGLGVVAISNIFPSCDLVEEGLFVRDAAIEALGRKDAEFGLRHIEPTAVFSSPVKKSRFGQATSGATAMISAANPRRTRRRS
jgi:hypothetical protein